LLIRTYNTERNKSPDLNCAEISEQPLFLRISAPGVLAHISRLEESVHDVECDVTAQLQQELPVVITVTITMSAEHIRPYPSIHGRRQGDQNGRFPLLKNWD